MKLESTADVMRQDDVAAQLAAAWNCEWSSMGPYGAFDVYMTRGKKVVALVEIKTTDLRDLGSRPFVYFDLHKYLNLHHAEIVTGIPTFYVYAMNDGIFWVRVADLPVRELDISKRGRADREGLKDAKPTIGVPADRFVRISPKTALVDCGAP